MLILTPNPGFHEQNFMQNSLTLTTRFVTVCDRSTQWFIATFYALSGKIHHECAMMLVLEAAAKYYLIVVNTP